MSSKKLRVGLDIKAPEICLIDAEGEKLGVMSVQQAMSHAEKADMQLVEVSPHATPPVCKIMDYGRRLFRKKKVHQKPKRSKLKEVKIRPNTEENDYQVKLRSAKRFLEAGNKVKVSMRFRGRELWHQALGLEQFKRLEADLAEYGAVEQQPQLDGRQMVAMLSPKRASEKKQTGNE